MALYNVGWLVMALYNVGWLVMIFYYNEERGRVCLW